MRSLFTKIFLWFWVADVLVAGALILATIWTEPKREEDRFPRIMDDMIGFYGRQAVDAYEKNGKKGLSDYLNNLEKTRYVQGYLLLNGKEDILGRTLPADVQEMVSHFTDMEDHPLPPDLDRMGPPDEREHFDGPPDRDDHRLPPPPGFISPIQGSANQQYLFMVKRPPKPFHRFFERPLSFVVQLSAIVFMAGIVCYGLALYLTFPLRKLQFAARRLATGDFSFRIGQTIGNRHDEIGDLSRDFDFMVERIESLILGQKRLLRDISHELRSPLARLTVALELARKRAGSDATDALNRIDLEITRINDLIGRLITLVRLDNDIPALGKTEFGLADLVQDIAKDADFEAQGSNRRVCVRACEDCTILGSPELLRSAVENVVRNAVRYTKENTQVEISLSRQVKNGDPFAVLCVRDYGPGVPESDLAKIFQPFYRVADSRDRMSGGVGLGLAITERAVKLHGGTIEVANVPDGGFAVTISLPIYQRHPQAQSGDSTI